MTTTAIRQKVHQYIDEADESVIRALFTILSDSGKQGNKLLKSLSIDEYNKSLELAEKEINEGKYLDQAEAVKEIRKW